MASATEAGSEASTTSATNAPPKARREIADLPAPGGLPLLGNLLQFDTRSAHAQVESWAQRFGAMFRFRAGRRHLVVVTDHRVIGALLRDRPDGFRRSSRLEAIGRELGLTGGVFNAEGEVWRRQRKMVMAAFDPRHLRAYFPSLVRVAARLQARWRRASRAREGIDLQADLMRFTVDAVSGLAFGAQVNTLESDDDVIQRHLDKIFPALFRRLYAFFPSWRWWKTRADRELEHSVAAVGEAIRGFVAAARARLAAEPGRRETPADLLEAMLVASETPGSGISDAEVSGNVLTMLLAGEDTTANTLAWMIHLLQRHPVALERARAEIDAVAGAPAEWTLERFAALPWVEACTHETMRMKPVAPMMVIEALRETAIDGVRIPAGTLVWLALRHDSLREDCFADAASFRPERWLDKASELNAASTSRIAMPFGAGPRVCPGRQLAMLEIKVALAALLGAFEIESVATAGGGEPAEELAFTMAPETLTMRLRERA
jgi:cytochrome P450